MRQAILLIEDDQSIANFMEVILDQDRYQLTTADTGIAGLNTLQTESIDLVLLDLGLPDIDGIDVLKTLRKQTYIPVIIISARNDEKEKVTALDLGADDYITKPFGTNELLARIRTALRHRKTQNEYSTIIKTKDLKIDIEKQLVYKYDQEIHLTKNEYLILLSLFRQLGKVVTYKSLMLEVWGPYYHDAQTLRVNMFNIRKKIESNTLNPEYLITEIGVGYLLRDYRP